MSSILSGPNSDSLDPDEKNTNNTTTGNTGPLAAGLANAAAATGNSKDVTINTPTETGNQIMAGNDVAFSPKDAGTTIRNPNAAGSVTNVASTAPITTGKSGTLAGVAGSPTTVTPTATTVDESQVVAAKQQEANLQAAAAAQTVQQQAAAQANAQNMLNAAHQASGGAYAAQSVGQAIAQQASVNQGATALAKAQDQAQTLTTFGTYISNQLDNELNTHAVSIQQATSDIQNAVGELQNQLAGLTGAAKTQLQSQIDTMNASLSQLSSQTASDAQSSSEFWNLATAIGESIAAVAAGAAAILTSPTGVGAVAGAAGAATAGVAAANAWSKV